MIQHEAIRDFEVRLQSESGVEVLRRTSDDALLALFPSPYRLRPVAAPHPGRALQPLTAGG